MFGMSMVFFFFFLSNEKNAIWFKEIEKKKREKDKVVVR